jgi:hypothetical protein
VPGLVRIELTTAAAVLVAAALAGCGLGLGPGPGTSNVTMTVTRGFGASQIGFATEVHVPGSETVMRMLERRFKDVQTRYGGGFVESIDGQSGNSARTDWFYYVNGVQASKGAATTVLNKGDRVWWDLHDWSVTDTVPAVVGSYPEPFLHGLGGKRFPTTVECASDVGAACKLVKAALDRVKIPFASQFIGTGSGPDTLGVVVGTWKDIRGEVASALIAHGPSASGIYARFTANGTALQLLDPRGQAVRTLGADAGLVAATLDSSSAAPTWLITGTDAAGVADTAKALNGAALHDHFALAVQGGTDLPVPLDGNS